MLTEHSAVPDWQPIQGMPCRSPYDSEEQLQPNCNQPPLSRQESESDSLKVPS